MKYNPEKMLRQSRFRDLAQKLPAQDYEKALENMRRLIAENSEYADKKNYGHMCNLLSSLALTMMYEGKGVSRAESQRIVLGAMYEFLKPQVASMQRLASHSWFVPMLKKFMPIKFKNTLGHGWNVEFPPAPKNEFKMVTHACIYAQIFEKYGMPEMTAGFCRVDNLLNDNLPGTSFSYTQRIGEGGCMCDYTYKRISK